MTEARKNKIRKTIGTILKSTNKRLGFPLNARQKLEFQKQLTGEVLATLVERDWTHIDASQQEDYEKKLLYKDTVISQKNESIRHLVAKLKAHNIL